MGYEPDHRDCMFTFAVWGRSPWLENRAVIVRVFRRTALEARAFVAGLGYEFVDAGDYR